MATFFTNDRGLKLKRVESISGGGTITLASGEFMEFTVRNVTTTPASFAGVTNTWINTYNAGAGPYYASGAGDYSSVAMNVTALIYEDPS